MSDFRRRRSPSFPFVGALLGVLASLIVWPSMMLTAGGMVVWLLVWPGLGLLAGATVEAILARIGGESDT